jgi:hypothetical protein
VYEKQSVPFTNTTKRERERETDEKELFVVAMRMKRFKIVRDSSMDPLPARLTACLPACFSP